MSEDDIAAYLTVKPGAGLDAEKLGELARANLSRYMMPRYIRVVDELPKTPTAKIRKDALRREAESDLGAFFDADLRRHRKTAAK
jgi:crotonobetaine/carnitine-CoA ligase